MTQAVPNLAPVWFLALVLALGGFVMGCLYFAALRRTVRLLGAGSERLGPIAFTLGRLAAAVLFFVASARAGALPLLGALGGFLLARMAAARAMRRTP